MGRDGTEMRMRTDMGMGAVTGIEMGMGTGIRMEGGMGTEARLVEGKSSSSSSSPGHAGLGWLHFPQPHFCI